MNIFEKSIKELQLNNVLVVLKVAGGAYDGQLLQEMVKEYKLVDLSLPVLRLQVEQNPLGFAQSLELPAYLANMQYTPSLLPAGTVSKWHTLGQSHCQLQPKLLFAGAFGQRGG